MTSTVAREAAELGAAIAASLAAEALIEDIDDRATAATCGILWTAAATGRVGAWQKAIRTTREREIDIYIELRPKDITRRTGSAVHLGGVFESCRVRALPALLAHGTRRVAVGQAVRIWQRPPVSEVYCGRSPR